MTNGGKIKMETKVTSIRLGIELKKQIKLMATQKDITQSELINKYLKDGLRKDGVEIQE